MYLYQLCISFRSTDINSVMFSACLAVSHHAVRALSQMCGSYVLFLFFNLLNLIKAFGKKIVISE